MKVTKLVGTIAAGALLAGASWSIAAAQGAGTVYAFHSGPTAGCPTLDWHIVRGDNGELNGMVSWDGMKSMAHVSGVVGPDKMIKMTAKEVGGARGTAIVTGDARNDGWLVLNIKGAHVDCQGIKVPIWRTSGTTNQ